MNLIDMHCDTIWKLMEDNTGASLRNNHFCIDMDGMKKAGTLVQFFACFVYMQNFQGADRYTKGYHHALDMIRRMEEEVEKEKTQLGIIKSLKELEVNRDAGKISALLTVEEGGILDSDINRLAELYEKGIRLMTILWNEENCIGFPNSRNRKIMEQGLKPFGFEVVERMNELGMAIDVSHLSDGGFWDVLKASRVPVVATHSNAREICPHPRNLSDEMMRALAEKGGVAGVNFYPYFLNSMGKAGIEDIVRHITHMVDVGGIDFPAIGTDFDGYDDGKNEITHVAGMELVYHGLRKSGYTEGQIEKIWSGNAMSYCLNALKCDSM